MNISCATRDDLQTLHCSIHYIINELKIYNERAKEQQRAEFTEAYIKDVLENQPEAILICEVDSSFAGFCITHPEPNDSIWISWYAVLPKWRGRNIGTALLEKLIATSKATGRKKLACDTRMNNKASIAILQKLNFKKTGRAFWFNQGYFEWELML